MRATVDLPDYIYREIKAAAARRGITVRDFILNAVEKELGALRRRRRIRPPLIRTGSPGTLSLTNAEIEELLA